MMLVTRLSCRTQKLFNSVDPSSGFKGGSLSSSAEEY